eukprot:TRINITY_DN5918_c0_g1_i1.p1 TRINITY_DN5918_c0_g1~~TRINITY_DN5918_c0_g1_i1.p1  ORF type:complete len:460 (+),score=54.75 TRINITY_DN5918_c0_g1_i1:77-1456(+)
MSKSDPTVVSTFRTKLHECAQTNKGWRNLVSWIGDHANSSDAIVNAWRDEFLGANADPPLVKSLLQPVGLILLEKNKNPQVTPVVECFSKVLEDTVKKALQSWPRKTSNSGTSSPSPTNGTSPSPTPPTATTAAGVLKRNLQAWQNLDQLGDVPARLLSFISTHDNLNKLVERFPDHDIQQLESLLKSCNNNVHTVTEKLQAASEVGSPLSQKSNPVDDPASELSVKSQRSILSDGVSSMSSWADEVEAEMPEFNVPVSPAASAAMAARQSGKSYDQFANRPTLTQAQLQQHSQSQQAKLLKQQKMRAMKANGVNKQMQAQLHQQAVIEKAKREKEKQQVAAAASVAAAQAQAVQQKEREKAAAAAAVQQERAQAVTARATMPTTGPSGKPLSDSELVQMLWSKVVQLEQTCRSQDDELNRLHKLENKVSKLDEFVLETRTEMGKIIQRQLNTDRGVHM